MPIQNSDVADIFEKVADFLELEGETRSGSGYRDAARTVGGHSRSVAEMVED
jgi:DNA polymerase/3'-5' exonuclease PolX